MNMIYETEYITTHTHNVDQALHCSSYLQSEHQSSSFTGCSKLTATQLATRLTVQQLDSIMQGVLEAPAHGIEIQCKEHQQEYSMTQADLAMLNTHRCESWIM